PDRELLDAVEECRRQAVEHAATVLVDDRVDVAALAGVGVHLGEEDLPAGAARALLAPHVRVGVSTHDLAAARRAFADRDADYVAFGPVFPSGTKPGREARGIEALAEVAREKTKPLVAIGGITEARLDMVLDAGADSAAAIGAFAAGGRLEENARALLDRARRRDAPGRLYLVGFMGSGKTSIGRRVAERLSVPFVDLDTEIERTSGLTVRALFESLGEPAFRDRESTFLEGTEALPHAVVSAGGGSFVSERNRRSIARLGTAVSIEVPFERIRERLSGKTDRPLFVSVDQAARLFADREPFYRMAPVRVALTGRESIEESADKVLSAVYDRRELGGPRLG
ncbi:MAG TPA: thiamine phosphate synthase, partial [Thermoanaerobaculia bacterium]|nr:thiamine phosphate synthase [Thermoanaerobaculia bacterium]